MKKVLSILTLLALTGTAYAYNYDNTLPLPGKTLTEASVQEEALFPVYAFGLRAASPDCKNFAIVDTEVSQEKLENKWQEIWTIKACSKNVLIPVNIETKDSGTRFAIDPINVKVRQVEQ